MKRFPHIIRIAVLSLISTFTIQKDENVTSSGSVEAQLLYTLSKQLRFEYELLFVRNFDDVMELFVKNKVDIAIGSILVTEERHKILDFTLPYFT